MLKKIIILLIVLSLLGLLAAAAAVRKLPDLAVLNLCRTLGREVEIGSLKVRFPLRLEMVQLTVAENAPFEGEPALQIERAVADVDPWALISTKELHFSRIELTRPKLTFRKSDGKVYHAFRFRPAGAAPAADGGVQNTAEATRPGGIPPLKFDRVVIRDGGVRLIDYDADRKGFVVTLLRTSAEIDGLSLPQDGRRLDFMIEGLLDQGRDAAPGRLELKGHWSRGSLEGEMNLSLRSVQLPYFEPYYRQVTPSLISDGELDLVASAKSPHGILTAHSKWTLRRLAFGKTESNDQLLGFDANLIQGILAGDDGILSLDLELEMDLRSRTTPFREVLLQSLRRSIRATFLSNFDSAVKSTVDKLAEKAPSLLADGNWKDLLKKNKRQDILNEVMNPS